MTFEEYQDQVREDAEQAMKEAFDFDPEQDFEEVFDQLFIDDSVTGNASGTYSNAWQAAENIAHLIWDYDFQDMMHDEFGYTLADLVQRGPETIDVIIRCAALDTIRGELEEAWNSVTSDDNSEEE